MQQSAEKAAPLEKQEKGDGQNGGWLWSHVEAPTCETCTRLCEKPSCASSTFSHLTHLRKLAPHFTHIEPSPHFPPVFLQLRLQGRRVLDGEDLGRGRMGSALMGPLQK